MWQMLLKLSQEMGEDGKDYQNALAVSRSDSETALLHSHLQRTSLLCCAFVK